MLETFHRANSRTSLNVNWMVVEDIPASSLPSPSHRLTMFFFPAFVIVTDEAIIG